MHGFMLPSPEVLGLSSFFSLFCFVNVALLKLVNFFFYVEGESLRSQSIDLFSGIVCGKLKSTRNPLSLKGNKNSAT